MRGVARAQIQINGDQTRNMQTKRIEIDVPDMDQNGYVSFDLIEAEISCSYDETHGFTEIHANKKGLVALAKVFLQLAMSDEENTHTEMDQFGYFTEGSSGLSIVKKSDGRE